MCYSSHMVAITTTPSYGGAKALYVNVTKAIRRCAGFVPRATLSKLYWWRDLRHRLPSRHLSNITSSLVLRR